MDLPRADAFLNLPCRWCLIIDEVELADFDLVQSACGLCQELSTLFRNWDSDSRYGAATKIRLRFWSHLSLRQPFREPDLNTASHDSTEHQITTLETTLTFHALPFSNKSKLRLLST